MEPHAAVGMNTDQADVGEALPYRRGRFGSSTATRFLTVCLWGELLLAACPVLHVAGFLDGLAIQSSNEPPDSSEF